MLLLAVVLGLALVPASGFPQARTPWTRHEPVPEPDYPEVAVTADWLVRHLDSRDVIVIDCRPAQSYGAGHVPGAISCPPESLPTVGSLPDLERLSGFLSGMGLSGRERIVCCGEVPSSEEAGLLFWLLELAGAERAAVLGGGVVGWRAAGHELSVDGTRRTRGTWKPDPNPELLATREYVRRSFGEIGVEIVDARGLEAWWGPVTREEWETPPRVGHIPHALPFDFTSFFAPDGTLLAPSETWSSFGKLGPRPANPVSLQDEFIVYGWGGAGGPDGEADERWGHGPLAYFLLRRAGIESVRLYPGGWGDWARDQYLPIVRIVRAEELTERLGRSRRWLRPSDPPQDFAFFDVRHPADHANGHIRGAVTLRSDYFADSLDIRLESHWPGIERATTPVVTYCYGESCIRSRATSTAAARAGFVQVERFYGGIDEWRFVGGTLVRRE